VWKYFDLEKPMTQSSSGIDADEFLDFITALMRYRRHVIDTLPEHVTKFKKRLEKAQRSSDSKYSSIDKDLFYRIGLVILSRYKEPMPMGELSRALDVPQSTATRMVDDLVESGVAVRIADPEDRRIVRVTLTEEGRELHQTISEYMRQRIDQLLIKFTAEEREQLSGLLRKAVESLNENSKDSK
jgi:DNA-binding MarR family transcriptional regulator